MSLPKTHYYKFQVALQFILAIIVPQTGFGDLNFVKGKVYQR
jgi:hypothetical protein